MRCLKCKKEISDELLRCNYCNTKVKSVCPICGTINPITSEFCDGCGLQLLKYCPICHSVNYPDASECRKCHTKFEKEEGLSITDLKELSDEIKLQKAKNENIKEQEKEIKQETASSFDTASAETEKSDTQQTEENTSNNIKDEDKIAFQKEVENSLEDTPLQLDEMTDFEMQEYDPNEQFEVLEISEEEFDKFQDNDIVPEYDEINKQKTVDTVSQNQEQNETGIKANIEKEIKETQKELAQETSSKDKELTVKNNTEQQQNETAKEPKAEQPKEQIKDNTEKISATDSSTDSAQTKESPKIQETKKEEIKDTKIDNPERETVENAQDTSYDDGPVKACDQLKCKNLIVNAIRKPEKLIIGMSAPEGSGKSTVLKYLFNDLMHQNHAWLWGECSANSQISPFGIFQEMILTFFNMPNFSNMSQDFVKQAKTMLSATFPNLSQDEVFNLFNFLYPNLTSNFEEILVNKDYTFALLEKLILEISKKAKLIIVIDDFDMIDGASYAFLSYFVDQGHLGENIKLIITYKDNRITQGYFYSEKLSQNQYEDIRLAKLTKADTDNLIKMFFNGINPLPEELTERIFNYSKGNSAYIEQALVLLNDFKSFVPDGNVLKYRKTQIEDKLPKNFQQILALRLNILQKKYPKEFKTLCTAAIMGNKFNVKLLEIIMKYNPEEFQTTIQMLCSFAYISQFNNNIFEFKNTLLWKFVYEKAKRSKDFVVINEKIFDIINSFTLSSNSLKALIAQNLNQKLLALNIWTENIKLCAYLGDEHLWTLSQKQCLKIAQEIHPENNNVIINNIQERLGKLLYNTRPSEAVPYLSNAISNAIKINNSPKIVELSGYLSKSCSLIGNYNGVIEAIDMILQIVETPENKLETALIKYKKLKAMFCIGNAEEIYNLASNEIIPTVEQALSNVIPNNNISMDIIYETWLECNLIVVMAMISQGNKKCFDILSVIDEIVSKNNVTNKNYLQRLKLAKALAYSIQGNIKKSEDILVEFTQETAKEILEPNVISLWNFTNILNKIYKRDWQNIKEDMYSVVTFANNYNDVLIKNLLKVFLGKILQEEGNLSKALDIFNEQVTIFAREKIAIGALLCWYYIAKITLVTEGTDKALDISQKALDVAKNPKISNYYFMVLYKKLIAEIFLIKGDMEAAKMYIEKALMIVKEYDMKLLKVQLYQLYAKYLEEMVSKKPQNKATYAQNAMNTYKKVLTLVEHLGIEEITKETQKNFASFKAFCQLNNLKV